MKLFEVEVPEIREGIVEIKLCAREPGARSKIAVTSKDRDVDPVGACVGMKGIRVQNVIQELKGEKIDIIPWSDNPVMFVRSALAPAEISSVRMDEAQQDDGNHGRRRSAFSCDRPQRSKRSFGRTADRLETRHYFQIQT